VELLKKHSLVADWCALTRISNLPTLLSNAGLGIAIAALCLPTKRGDSLDWAAAAITAAGLASFYMAGMVLNGIVDRAIDAQERPTRPIAAGRIRLQGAWTGFILLMFMGFVLRPSPSAWPVPVAVAALVGVWTLAAARSMRSTRLHSLAKGWCAIAVVAAIWWAIDTVARTPFDLSSLDEFGAHTVSTSFMALNGASVLLAASLVLYNFTHTRGAWSIAFLTLCRVLVPVSMALALLVPSGAFGGYFVAKWSVPGAPIMSRELTLSLLALGAVAAHTVIVSLVARSEVRANATHLSCGRCGYPASHLTDRCSECGASFTECPPVGERALATRDRWLNCLLAAIPLLMIILIVGAIALSEWRSPASTAIGGATLLTGVGSARVVYGIFTATAFVFGCWYFIAASRGLRAARMHETRRPAGVAAVIAAFTLLDGCAAAALGSVEIAIGCAGMWFLTRLLHRQVPGS
jgi:4-hydroxybenzoate polyprenyltransferase